MSIFSSLTPAFRGNSFHSSWSNSRKKASAPGLCRQLFVDPVRQDHTIASPVHQVFSPRYPVTDRFAVFARWSNDHWSYEVDVLLRSLDGDVLCGVKVEAPFEAHDPRQVWMAIRFASSYTCAALLKYAYTWLRQPVEVPEVEAL